MTNLRQKAIELRKKGLTFSLIQDALRADIPKSTLSYWLKSVEMTDKAQLENKRLRTLSTEKSRKMAVMANKAIRQKYLNDITEKYSYLKGKIDTKDTALIALAMLYMGEGSKAKKGSLSIGNSDPNVIKLFLYLLNLCFNIDSRKFRCTVQCRADQDTEMLEKYWSRMTAIPPSQFYKTRIDPRTIGKPSRKLDYKGVCNLEYFSADIFNTLMQIISILTKGL